MKQPAVQVDRFFQVALRDLGELDTRLSGILRPEPETGAGNAALSDRFSNTAEVYAARYSNRMHFGRLFQQAFAAARVTPRPEMTVLDLGTGSGAATIQPCLDVFPDCQIVATDSSPDLLRMLRYFVVQEGLEDQVACVCTDAMNNFFKPESFDVVLGAAVLHRLTDPLCALDATYRALKPGGSAFFFEPFEGLSIIQVAFELILERSAREDLPLLPATAKVLAGQNLDAATRAGSDKPARPVRHRDDKWLFTREWLVRSSRASGFDSIAIVPHSSHTTLFRDYVLDLLKLRGSLGPDALPDWAWEVLAVFDRAFPGEMKRDVLLEATIVLHKPR